MSTLRGFSKVPSGGCFGVREELLRLARILWILEEAAGEADLSTKQPTAKAQAWLSNEDADPSWPRRDQGAAVEVTRPFVGLILRIKGRASFRSLTKEGVRVRRGPLSVTYCPPDFASEGANSLLAGFAIGRKAGSAVVRNRMRRRIRAIIGANQEILQPGMYLVGAGAGARELAGAELERRLLPMLLEVGRRPRPSRFDGQPAHESPQT